MAVASDMDL
jgi:hypothetical protein